MKRKKKLLAKKICYTFYSFELDIARVDKWKRIYNYQSFEDSVRELLILNEAIVKEQ